MAIGLLPRTSANPLGERLLIEVQLEPLQRPPNIDAQTVTDLVFVILKSRSRRGNLLKEKHSVWRPPHTK